MTGLIQTDVKEYMQMVEKEALKVEYKIALKLQGGVNKR